MMRNRIINLLKSLEEKDSFNDYHIEYFVNYQTDYTIKEYIEFPNYNILTKKYNELYPTYSPDGDTLLDSEIPIRYELKRMEQEGLITIGSQKGLRNACTDKSGPDFDDNIKFTCESIILTTKGKNIWKYFVYKATEENPIATILSLIAIIISIIAILK